MTELFLTCLLWFGAIGCGLLAGLYFAFSVFIMTALGRIEQAQGISAMKSINSTILTSLFMVFFFGTTLASLIFVVIGFVRRGAPGAMAMLSGGLIYVAGMFLSNVVLAWVALEIARSYSRREREKLEVTKQVVEVGHS